MIFSALKPVILRDSDSFRQNIFSNLRSSSLTVRYAEKMYSRSPSFVKALLLLGYGLKGFLDAPELTNEISCVYSYENERKRFEYLKEIFGPRKLKFCQTSPGNISLRKLITLLRNTGDVPRILQILSFISDRFDFLVSSRISATIFYYAWFESELRRKKPDAIFLSSEANPNAMGLLWAARKFSIPSIYVPHGQVSPFPPRLFFDLALLDGEELKSTFEERGTAVGRIIFKGTDGDYRPLRTEKLDSPDTVGVFLSVIYDSMKLENVIRQIHSRFPESKILIRLHPNESISSSEILGRLRDLKNIRTNPGQSLADEINSCDVIFCGNSGTHLEALRFGVPTIQVPDLDLHPHDTRKFILNRVVPWFSGASSVNVTELKNFYSGDWPVRMKRYDFYYGTQRKEINSILRTEIENWFKARQEKPDSVRLSPGRKT